MSGQETIADTLTQVSAGGVRVRQPDAVVGSSHGERNQDEPAVGDGRVAQQPNDVRLPQREHVSEQCGLIRSED